MLKNPKVWAVLGAMDGLGNAATKYLVANRQIVLAFTQSRISVAELLNNPAPNLYMLPGETFSAVELKETLMGLTARLGPIDYIINNSNYGLFQGSADKTPAEIQGDIDIAVPATIKLIETIIPYLCSAPKGRLINVPPQLCLTVMPSVQNSEKMASALELFLGLLRLELQEMDCRLSFLEPGERLMDKNL